MKAEQSCVEAEITDSCASVINSKIQGSDEVTILKLHDRAGANLVILFHASRFVSWKKLRSRFPTLGFDYSCHSHFYHRAKQNCCVDFSWGKEWQVIVDAEIGFSQSITIRKQGRLVRQSYQTFIDSIGQHEIVDCTECVSKNDDVGSYELFESMVVGKYYVDKRTLTELRLAYESDFDDIVSDISILCENSLLFYFQFLVFAARFLDELSLDELNAEHLSEQLGTLRLETFAKEIIHSAIIIDDEQHSELGYLLGTCEECVTQLTHFVSCGAELQYPTYRDSIGRLTNLARFLNIRRLVMFYHFASENIGDFCNELTANAHLYDLDVVEHMTEYRPNFWFKLFRNRLHLNSEAANELLSMLKYDVSCKGTHPAAEHCDHSGVTILSCSTLLQVIDEFLKRNDPSYERTNMTHHLGGPVYRSALPQSFAVDVFTEICKNRSHPQSIGCVPAWTGAGRQLTWYSNQKSETLEFERRFKLQFF